MMNDLKKILNAEQIRNVDNHTISNKPIPSIDLMEYASNCFVNSIWDKQFITKKIAVVCGTGNNGGDGLAISRLLKEKKVSVKTYFLNISSKISKDCQLNLTKLGSVEELTNSDPIPNFSKYDLIIDAIFGTGLSKPVGGYYTRIIDSINSQECSIYSVDIPSGMYCDKISDSKHIINADLTVSFQRPKLSFFLPESGAHIKKWRIIDIGLDEEYIQNMDSNKFIIDERIRKHIKTRNRQSHKGNYGRALIIAGSIGKIGAAVLAAKACLRSGVGLLTTHTPKCGYEIMQKSIPESMCSIDKAECYISESPEITNYNAIGIGPGLDQKKDTKEMLEKLFNKAKKGTLVLDADAINIIAKHKELISLIPKNSILTPHIKEFERLVGKCKNSIERFEKQIEFSKTNKCIIVLKNAFTTISTPMGDIFFNTSGNAGMATAGSGDVLTGIITSLLAQKYDPAIAAALGVYCHGHAGDVAAKEKGELGLIASDIIDHLKFS